MTARELFIGSEHAKEFGRLAANPAFENALNAALVTLIESQPREMEISKSWDAHAQLVGARRFADILRTIHHKQETPKREPWPNLQQPKIEKV